MPFDAGRRRLRQTLLHAALAAPLLVAGARPAAAGGLEEAGRRIYEAGILPDGTPLMASRFGGSSVVRGEAAACANCHRRSGYGSREGTIVIPPVAGAALFAPGVFAPRTRPTVNGTGEKRPAEIERFRTRPAYGQRSLARALRSGIDPGGMPLADPMPRYQLDSRAVAALAAYLRRLSDEPVPGLDPETLHLGVPFAPDVTPERRAAILDVLRVCTAGGGPDGRRWQLHVWQLAGSAGDWSTQLETHYRRQPVFALLSGAGAAEWQPVQSFCERNGVPCVLPAVEAPPLHESDRYSFHFSAGLDLEIGLLAHHLRSAGMPGRLIQVHADESGRRTAAGLRRALAGSNIAVESVPPEALAAAAADLADNDAIVLWLRPREVEALATVAPPRAQLFVSAMLAAPEELALPPTWKSAVSFLSIFDPLAPRRAQYGLAPWLTQHGIALTEQRTRGDAYAACNLFGRAVAAIRNEDVRGIAGPATRERVVEALEGLLTAYRDDGAPYYWQMSLGPGQRVAVKGAALLRYATPEAEHPEMAGPRIVP